MITVAENLSKKLPCKTSLYYTLTSYNKELFDRLAQISGAEYDKKSSTFEIPINKAFYLINTLLGYDSVTFKPYKEKQKDIEPLTARKYKVKPYKHQIEAIEYGLSKKNWLLMDSCGLGKTSVMINLADELRKQGKVKHCLIICGVNSLKYNWASEIEKFSNLSYKFLGQRTTRTGKTVIGTVADRLDDLKGSTKEFFVITNVETLQNTEFAKTFKKSKTQYDMIIVDEIHRIKSPSSLSAKTLLKLKAEYSVALSGTIIVNDPENAYVPLKWTGNTSANFTAFKLMYNVYGGFGNRQVIGYKNLDLLQELIQSCSLRRRKEDVLDLPDKTMITEYVEMGKEQRALYDEVAAGIASELDKLEQPITIMQEIAINMRLRQITASPSMLSTAVTKSAKLSRLCELVAEIVAQGDKIVIFNTFKQAAYDEAELLKEYNPLICTGNQSDIEIEENKRLFEKDEHKVMICTWQKMGTGHTLTPANYMIFVDTPYTAASYEQACDRIYRIGQNKKVFIITLITKDSYDERVKEIIERKEQLAGYLVDNIDIDNLVMDEG